MTTDIATDAHTGTSEWEDTPPEKLARLGTSTFDEDSRTSVVCHLIGRTRHRADAEIRGDCRMHRPVSRPNTLHPLNGYTCHAHSMRVTGDSHITYEALIGR